MDLISAIKELTLGPNFFKTALKERRDIPRIACHIKAYARIQNKPVLLRITDVSLKGLRVESFIRLSADMTFQITAETDTGTLSFGGFSRDTLMVKVAWCRKKRYKDAFNAGLLFADSQENIRKSWVYYLFKEFEIEEDLSKKRKTLRIPVEIPVFFTDPDGKISRGVIENIGMGGVLIKCAEEIAPGKTFELTLGPYKNLKRITLQGSVLRSRFLDRTYQWLMAVKFSPLSPKQFKSIGKMILEVMKLRKVVKD